MSKTRIGIAGVVLAILLSSAAQARVRLGIGRLAVARFAVARVLALGGLHHASWLCSSRPNPNGFLQIARTAW
jgi:hypothetical protein